MPTFLHDITTDLKKIHNLPSLQSLGELIGVSASTLSRWEEGQGTQQIDQFLSLLALLPPENLQQHLHHHFYAPQFSIFRNQPNDVAESYLVCMSLSMMLGQNTPLSKAITELVELPLSTEVKQALSAWLKWLKQGKIGLPEEYYQAKFNTIYSAGSRAAALPAVLKAYAQNMAGTCSWAYRPSLEAQAVAFEFKLFTTLFNAKVPLTDNLEHLIEMNTHLRRRKWQKVLDTVKEGNMLLDCHMPFNVWDTHWLKLLLLYACDDDLYTIKQEFDRLLQAQQIPTLR